jgi:gamma-glutamyltranspeptidase/glutathione hydrolase
MQLISFITDFSMDPEQAMHQPRVDVSGVGEVVADAAFEPAILQALRDKVADLSTADHGVYPSLFGCPSIARFDPASGCSTGAAFVQSPLAAAVAEPVDC